ncbi:hypothetical protein VTL71DRAFT_13464 [Oculimacula yallundae]|uniref:Uncharacterized protein n=1 Tax=Oculimacula yallundae TaxID=86028 RepID=A0ABR4CKJ7_9HELO
MDKSRIIDILEHNLATERTFISILAWSLGWAGPTRLQLTAASVAGYLGQIRKAELTASPYSSGSIASTRVTMASCLRTGGISAKCTGTWGRGRPAGVLFAITDIVAS